VLDESGAYRQRSAQLCDSVSPQLVSEQYQRLRPAQYDQRVLIVNLEGKEVETANT
jgi:hypothetical protein